MRTVITVYWTITILFTVLVFYGWVSNILAITSSDFTEVTGMLAIRCIGVVIAPLGVVMGYIQ